MKLNAPKVLSNKLIIIKMGPLFVKKHEVYSRDKNKFIKTTISEYHYSKGILDSITSRTYSIRENERTLEKSTTTLFEDDKIKLKKDLWIKNQVYKDQKSIIEYSYDQEDLLASSHYKGWNMNNELVTEYSEEYKYYSNKYVYRYLEQLKN